eukprot:c19837_g1_i1 orf=550-2016(-)
MSTEVPMVSPLISPQMASNISEFVHKVISVYRQPRGGFKIEEQIEEVRSCNEGVPCDGSSEMGTPSGDGEDSEAHSQKAQRSPSSDSSASTEKVQAMEALIFNIFTTVSALKRAYIRLQDAHMPYDPQKLQLADKAVINELRKLSEFKRSYSEKHAVLSGGQVLDLGGQLEMQNKEFITNYEGVISSFRSEMQRKNAEVEKLKDMLEQTTLKKEKLKRRVKKLEQRFVQESCVNILNELSPTVPLFESTLRGASEEARNFTKLLIYLMKACQWDLDAASNSIDPGICYARDSHRRFAFESYVCHRMLNGFEDKDFCISCSLSPVLDPDKHRHDCFSQFLDSRNTDPMEMISANPECPFGRFCCEKFLDLIHPKMEESFFGNLEHRNQLMNGTYPHTQFYQSFLTLARAMWLVHRLAFSFNPAASIFQVRRDTEFSPVYMESIAHISKKKAGSRLAVPQRVGFTVMPGFLVKKTFFKCQVYVLPLEVEE